MKTNSKTKRMVAMLLTLILTVTLMIALALPAAAATSGIYTYTVSDGAATITECDTSASGAIEIPSTLNGYRVTSIGDYAFADCTSLTSITIPAGVTSIGEAAFWRCDRLASITIPDSVTSIGDYAFKTCESLESITIPASVISIGDSAFEACNSLESITIPAGVTSIGAHAFEACESFTSITIPDSVTSIGDFAFYDCTSLASITVSVDNLNYSSIDGNLFNKNKTELIQYAIGKPNSFYDVPAGVTSIGEYAFADCSSLASITIPDGVTSIDYCAFHYCTSLASITIPDSVTSIGNYAFEGCDNLTDVYYMGSQEDWEKIDIGWNIMEATIHFNQKPKLKYDALNKEIIIKSDETIDSARLLVAAYKNGELLSIKLASVSISEGETRIANPMTDFGDADTVRILPWSSTGIAPLMGALEFTP